MALHGYENDWMAGDPEMARYLEEEERRKRRSQKYRWEEDRTLKDYIAATPKGERRFTNIPGADEGTFLMKEPPIQAPLGMTNGMKAKARYGVDPYEETRVIAQEMQAQGQTPDPEKIYTEVVDELSRKDEEARQQFGLQQAVFLKHGPPKQEKARAFADIQNEKAYRDDLRREETENIMFSLAEKSGGRIGIISSEGGGFVLTGTPTEAEVKGLKKKGYAVAEAWDGSSFNIFPTKRRGKLGAPKKKPTMLTREDLLGIGKQARFKELEQSVAGRIQQLSAQAATGAVAGAEGMVDEFGVPDMPSPGGVFRGQQLFRPGWGYEEWTDWVKRQRGKPSAWGKTIGLYGAQE